MVFPRRAWPNEDLRLAKPIGSAASSGQVTVSYLAHGLAL
jgi:hypothetical protein